MIFELLNDLDAIPTVPDEPGIYKVLPVYVTDIEANVQKTVAHNFGSSTYFVTAIQPDGTDIPNFNSIIEVSESAQLVFTSSLSYSAVTLLLIGVV